MAELTRCPWAEQSDLERDYHDNQWGIPLHDELRLFQMLNLEGMQAGLSWRTVLQKQDAMLTAFDGFDPHICKNYDDAKVAELMGNAGIIRNRLKIQAVIQNSRVYFDLCEKHGSLDNFLWRYVNHKPIVNYWNTQSEIPATTPLAEQISKDMKALGFKFVGPTIIYALLQAAGLINDHMVWCPWHETKHI